MKIVILIFTTPYADGIFIQSSTHSFSADGSRLNLPKETFQSSAAGNHTVSLSCQTSSRDSLWNVSGNLRIEWFFREEPISPDHAHLSSSVRFTERDGTMTMTSDDPWQLVGTVQCFVSVSTYTVFSADVHVVYEGESREKHVMA